MKYLQPQLKETLPLSIPQIIESVRQKIKFGQKDLNIIGILLIPYYHGCKMSCFTNIHVRYPEREMKKFCIHHGPEIMSFQHNKIILKRKNLYPKCKRCYFTLRRADYFTIEITIDKLLHNTKGLIRDILLDTNYQFDIMIKNCSLKIRRGG